jgi:hypothetical protein
MLVVIIPHNRHGGITVNILKSKFAATREFKENLRPGYISVVLKDNFKRKAHTEWASKKPAKVLATIELHPEDFRKKIKLIPLQRITEKIQKTLCVLKMKTLKYTYLHDRRNSLCDRLNSKEGSDKVFQQFVKTYL